MGIDLSSAALAIPFMVRDFAPETPISRNCSSLSFTTEEMFPEHLKKTLDDNEIKKFVSKLMDLMETYTNGGLQLIQDKLDLNDNYFVSSSDAPMQFMLSNKI